jgi:hypothetical protein
MNYYALELIFRSDSNFFSETFFYGIKYIHFNIPSEKETKR